MFIVLTALCLLFRYIVDVLPLRAILSQDLYEGTLRYPRASYVPEGAPERVYVPREGLGGLCSDRLARGSESSPKRLGCLPGRGVRVRGVRGVERLTAGQRSHSSKTWNCLGGKYGCERFHKSLDRSSGRLLMAGHNMTISSKRTLRKYPIFYDLLGFFRIYGDLSAYRRHNRKTGHKGFITPEWTNRKCRICPVDLVPIPPYTPLAPSGGSCRHS